MMKARFAPLLARLSMVSVIAVSALGAAACSRASTTTAPSVEQATEATPVTAEATPASRGPGHHLFSQLAALDLRDDQRAAVTEIEQNLTADLAPHRETMRQVAKTLATGIETGRLDPADAAAQQAALAAGILDAKASFADAMNAVHDVLDATQRAALVAQLQEQHANHHAARAAGAEGAEHAHGPIARLALELGLNEEQKANLRDEFRKHVEAIFPDRKAHRLESEAKMKAMGEAFISDGFDAADFDLGGGAEQALESFSETATHAIDVSGRLLSAPQRAALAALIRARADDHI